MASRSYANRSEAVRDLLRAELGKSQLESAAGKHCIACLSYVFNHHELDVFNLLNRQASDIDYDYAPRA